MRSIVSSCVSHVGRMNAGLRDSVSGFMVKHAGLIAIALAVVASAVAGRGAYATGDTAAPPFDLGVDIGSSVTGVMATAAAALGVIIGLALSFYAFSALWMWAKKGIKSR